MNIFRETTTVKLYQEVDRMTKMPERKEHRHLKGQKLKVVPKMYTGDTNKFEPIPENREHLIKTLMPMVLKLAKERSSKYPVARIELDDCISSGLQGAIIATDIYIEKSSIEQQPAKLSTYAYAYILKYINEYIYANTTSLSHGVTKGGAALQCIVLAGNKTNESADNGSGEYFETSNEPALMTIEELNPDTNTIDSISAQIFNTISTNEKSALFMFFGIGFEEPVELKKIAKALNISNFSAESLIQSGLGKLKEHANKLSNKTDIVEFLLAGNLNLSVHWQKPF